MSCVLELETLLLLGILYFFHQQKPHMYVTGRKLVSFLCLLSYILLFIEPCVFIGLYSFFSTPCLSIWFKGKSIALIHSGLPSYPLFLPSRIALFFNLQLTLLRSTCLSVLPSHSHSNPSSPHQPTVSLPLSCTSFTAGTNTAYSG